MRHIEKSYLSEKSAEQKKIRRDGKMRLERRRIPVNGQSNLKTRLWSLKMENW